jgi:ABC-type Fe3+-siderophore transport system permease subunit
MVFLILETKIGGIIMLYEQIPSMLKINGIPIFHFVAAIIFAIISILIIYFVIKEVSKNMKEK